MDYENIYDHLVSISRKVDKHEFLLACAKCLYCIPIDDSAEANEDEFFLLNEKEARIIHDKLNSYINDYD